MCSSVESGTTTSLVSGLSSSPSLYAPLTLIRRASLTRCRPQLRLFDSLVDHPVPDKSDLLQLVLSACKFLDLTLVLQTEEFQM